MEVKINVNGTERAADVEPRQLLVHVIRPIGVKTAGPLVIDRA